MPMIKQTLPAIEVVGADDAEPVDVGERLGPCPSCGGEIAMLPPTSGEAAVVSLYMYLKPSNLRAAPTTPSTCL